MMLKTTQMVIRDVKHVPNDMLLDLLCKYNILAVRSSNLDKVLYFRDPQSTQLAMAYLQSTKVSRILNAEVEFLLKDPPPEDEDEEEEDEEEEGRVALVIRDANHIPDDMLLDLLCKYNILAVRSSNSDKVLYFRDPQSTKIAMAYLQSTKVSRILNAKVEFLSFEEVDG